MGWIEIEVLMIAFIVLANSLFVGARALDRGRVEFYFDEG